MTNLTARQRWATIAAFVVAAAVVSFVFVMSARAEPNNVRINPPSATVASGSSVTVSVIGEAPAGGFDRWSIHVTYNAAVLDATGCQPHADGTCDIAFAPNKVEVAGEVQEDSLLGVNTLAGITFQVIGSDGQCSDLIIGVVDFADGEDVQLNPTSTNGQIIVGTSCGGPTPTTSPSPSPTPSPAPDADGDGWTAVQEAHIGTDASDPCGFDAWPADLVPEGFQPNTLNIQDLGNFIVPVRRMNTSPTVDPGFNVRWDLIPGTTFGKQINVADLASLTNGVTAYPPMLAPDRAFGRACPFPP